MIAAADIEFHAWPPRKIGGQQVGRIHFGVLAVHKPSGLAVVVDSERSQVGNQRLAVERISALTDAAGVVIGDWQR